MNYRNKENMTPSCPPMKRVIAFFPMPIKRCNNKNINSNVIYTEDGQYSIQYGLTAVQSFEAYAEATAYQSGIMNAKAKGTAMQQSKYGFSLADGHTFLKLHFRIESPTQGYISLWDVAGINMNLAKGTDFFMKNGLVIPSIARPTTVLQKIHDAVRFYDPKGERNPISCMVSDVPSLSLAKPFSALNSDDHSLLISTERDLRLTNELCCHLDAFPPSELPKAIHGLQERIKPHLEEIERDKNIRQEGLDAENGNRNSLEGLPSYKGDMVPRALYEEKTAELEKLREQNRLLAKVISLGGASTHS